MGGAQEGSRHSSPRRSSERPCKSDAGSSAPLCSRDRPPWDEPSRCSERLCSVAQLQAGSSLQRGGSDLAGRPQDQGACLDQMATPWVLRGPLTSERLSPPFRIHHTPLTVPGGASSNPSSCPLCHSPATKTEPLIEPPATPCCPPSAGRPGSGEAKKPAFLSSFLPPTCGLSIHPNTLPACLLLSAHPPICPSIHAFVQPVTFAEHLLRTKHSPPIPGTHDGTKEMHKLSQ